MTPFQKNLNQHIMRFARTLGAQLARIRACVEAGGDQAAMMECIRLVEYDLRNELTGILMTIYAHNDPNDPNDESEASV